MRIIIVGAGRIGRNLSKSLAEENNEVFLIEHNEEIARKAADKLDVKVINGSGTDPDILETAQVSSTDLVLAVTTSDSTNLVVCSLAGMFGAKRRIARVRNTSLSRKLSEFGLKNFNINEIINPELLAAQSIVKTVEAPGSSSVAEFAGGKIYLSSFDMPETSPLCGQRIDELRDEDFPWPFLIVAVIRNDEVFIPKGETVINASDLVYALLPAPSVGEFLTFVNPDIKVPKKIVIYGATMTGIYVAKALSQKIRDITLIEENEDVANKVAGDLKTVRIINGSATEADILTECGIEAADAFIATSENDHSNLVGSVLAKNMGAKETIITTQQPDYLSIADELDVDAIINPQILAVEQILHLVRGRGISSVIKLPGHDAEALEFVTEEGAAVTKDIIKNINFPKGSIVGAVYKGNDISLADGNTQIKAGDRAIVFCQETAVKKLQELFTQK